MYESAYEIIALTLRYWFVALIVFIFLRLALNVRREFAAEKTIKTKAKGFSLGMLEVIAPEKSKLFGKQFVLKRDNTLGNARRCDIILKHRSVSAVHAAIYQKGSSVYVSDYGGKGGVFLNGEKISKRDAKIADGDDIRIGDVVLCVSIKHIDRNNDGSSGRYRRQSEHEPAYDEYQDDEYENDDEQDYPAANEDDLTYRVGKEFACGLNEKPVRTNSWGIFEDEYQEEDD